MYLFAVWLLGWLNLKKWCLTARLVTPCDCGARCECFGANSFKRFATRPECYERIHNALPMYLVRVVNVISERVANVSGPTVSKDSQRAPNVFGARCEYYRHIRGALRIFWNCWHGIRSGLSDLWSAVSFIRFAARPECFQSALPIPLAFATRPECIRCAPRMFWNCFMMLFGARSQCIQRAHWMWFRSALRMFWGMRPTVSKDSQRAPNVLREFTTRSQCIQCAPWMWFRTALRMFWAWGQQFQKIRNAHRMFWDNSQRAPNVFSARSECDFGARCECQHDYYIHAVWNSE